MNPQRRRTELVHSQGPGCLTFTHAPAHTNTHTQLITGHSHLTLMIPGLIHTHISRMCVYQRASQCLSTVPLLPLCPQWGLRPVEPFSPLRLGGQDEIYYFAFYTKYSVTRPSCSHALIGNTKTAPQRKRRRGVSQRRAIKSARSVLCVRECVYILF